MHAMMVPVLPLPAAHPISTVWPVRARSKASAMSLDAARGSTGRPKSTQSMNAAGQVGRQPS